MILKDGSELACLPLEFLSEPAMLVGLDGHVHTANAAAHRLLSARANAPNIFDMCCGPKPEVAAFLRHASRSTSSYIGALKLQRGNEVERFRAMAARINRPDQEDTLIILRLMPAELDRFSILNRRIQEIDRQLHKRLKENALLVETLEDKRVLVQELQHRVKNNIQQMLSLMNFAAAGRNTPEVADFMSVATNRLRAMGASQEAIYQSNSVRAISSHSFLEEVACGAAESFGASDRLRLSIEDVEIPTDTAHNLALIANELIANAFKYGNGQVCVRLHCSGKNLVLDVLDECKGFNETTLTRSSGLKLVRSLCRQIGGVLQIAKVGTGKCSVQFEIGPERNAE
ncbi:sensor histidine kinase [Sulfitobacter sp. 915]|jgi:two-component sensor histidine kinase|uniref:sensor histidine kinase n=1 Tax=Sulfitobacter sp. 915 TaxID=3368558 RepID=UPI0037451AA0